MFTKKLSNQFTASLLSAVSGVLNEAKKCKDCDCAKCECDDAEEVDEATSLSDTLKRERAGKEKKEPNGVKCEGVEEIEEKRGLWDNIHAKRERIKSGSGERMRKPGSKGAPSATDLKASQTEEVEIDEVAPPGAKYERMVKHIKKAYAKDGKLTGNEKSIAYATAWKAKNEEASQTDEAYEDDEGWYAHREMMGNKGVSKEDWKKGYRMNLKGEKVMPKSKKTSTNEAFEQIDELSKGTMGRYVNKAADRMSTQGVTAGLKIAADEKSKKNFDTIAKRQKGIATAVSKLTKEETENLDELSKGTLGRYVKARRGDLIGAGMGMEHQNKDVNVSQKDRDRTNRKASNSYTGIGKAVDRLTKESATERDLQDHEPRKVQGVYGMKSKSFEKKFKNQSAQDKFFDHPDREGNYEVHYVSKMHEEVELTQEEQDFIESLNDADIEQIDELSKGTLGRYVNKIKGAIRRGKAKDMIQNRRDYAHGKAGDAYAKGDIKHGDRYMNWREKSLKKAGLPAQRVKVKEEVELDEARGRPRKAGAKEFTINPRTKEKLMHDNPEHMKKIEALQRNGVIPVPKTEAGQHVVNQLTKAKLSMRGGETINFTHGEPHHVSGEHAAKLLTRYAGMKPDEKEAFQKKIGHSHASLKSEL